MLEHIFFTNENEQLFFASALIIVSGARISEICHIELHRINIQERWFLTQVKSSKKNKRDGIYFFPQFFQSPLQQYIEHLKVEYPPQPTYLFPHPQNQNGYLSKRIIQQTFKHAKDTLGIEAKATPHSFRAFLNRKRFEQGCPDINLKFLLNHKTRETFAQNYLKHKENRLELRKIYDQYNPFRSDLLPEVLR